MEMLNNIQKQRRNRSLDSLQTSTFTENTSSIVVIGNIEKYAGNLWNRLNEKFSWCQRMLRKKRKKKRQVTARREYTLIRGSG